jgi:hypothetical protein
MTDERTPQSAVLFDGVESSFVRYRSPTELFERLGELSRRVLDGALRIGPRPGLNRPEILETIRLVRDGQIAAAAARLHAERATARREAAYGGNRGAKAWLRMARI